MNNDNGRGFPPPTHPLPQELQRAQLQARHQSAHAMGELALMFLSAQETLEVATTLLAGLVQNISGDAPGEQGKMRSVALHAFDLIRKELAEEAPLVHIVPAGALPPPHSKRG